MREQAEVVIVGAGFAGIGMGIRLKETGRHNFVILEKDDDLGGTWRDNTYPGCACDVPSSLYSFSFEQNPHWSRMFSPAEEIWDYLRHCVDKYELTSHLRYGAQVTGARFSTGGWDVDVNGATAIHAQVLVSGAGALHLPKTPDLPGIESFEGVTFHSARWRHDHDLTDRAVAVIGTGASAVQFVPEIQPKVARLSLFQRTAAWVTPKPDRPIPVKEQRLYEKHPVTQRMVRHLIYWTMEARGAGFALTPKAMKFLEVSAQRLLDRQVPDEALRAKLTPSYQIGCKRILLSNDYYPTLSRDNVEVVTDAIAQVRPHSIVTTAGTEHDVDTIIFGTGFEVSATVTHMNIVGRDGVWLRDVWSDRGIGAHLGMTVAGFPNFFLLLGPNTGLGHNSVIFMIESQIRYVLQVLDLLDARGGAYVDVRPEAEADFLARIQHRLADTVWASGCTSWYLDEHGRNFTIWPHFTWRYWLATRWLRPAQYDIRPSCQGAARSKVSTAP